MSTTPPPPTQPPFTPFFTLISNPASTSYTHPIVHYVFSDDDFDPYLAAETFSSSSNPQSHNSSQPPQQKKERIIIVDIAPDCTVSSARSLSPDWQVSGVTVSAAPQWMAPTETGEVGGANAGGLMLTIEGTESPGGKKVGEENVYELAEMFADRMARLKRVTEFGRLTAAAPLETPMVEQETEAQAQPQVVSQDGNSV